MTIDPAPEHDPHVLSVSEVNRLVAGFLTEHFNDIWIAGEVSGLRAYPSGHLYFTLKDEESQLDAVCFRSSAQRLGFELENGLEVVGHGRLDLYSPRGKYQMVLDRIEPRGVGALQLAFEKLKRKLFSEGLFDQERKRPLPVLPSTIGIVTSPAGAAIHDMLRTFRLGRARVHVLLYPVQVQGPDAGQQIAEGIQALNDHGKSDVIIVGRGGGSLEDLWGFNEEVVARAIATSVVPVVSGVGHEVDFTIADFAADRRAATPTAAAQLVAEGWLGLERKIGNAVDAVVRASERNLLHREQQLDELTRHRAFEVIRGALSDSRHAVERLSMSAESKLRTHLRRVTARLTDSTERVVRQHPATQLARRRTELVCLASCVESETLGRLSGAVTRTRTVAAKLDALSPLASLGRGYSICRKRNGTVVRKTDQVEHGEQVDVRITDGSLVCEVVAVQAESAD